MKRSDVEKALRRAECFQLREGGRHVIWQCGCGQHKAVVPRYRQITAGCGWFDPRLDCLQAEGMVAEMKTVTVEVRAEREGRLWVLHIADGGVTQARTLGEVEAMVADYVSLTRDVPAESVRVTLTQVDPGGGLVNEIAAVRQAQAEAALAQEDAAVRVRKTAKALRDRGLSGVEIATVLGVSKQRVSQLTASPSNATAARRSNTTAITADGRIRAVRAIPASKTQFQ